MVRNRCTKRKLGKETFIKHTYRNRKWDKEIQEAGIGGGKTKENAGRV